MICRYPLDDLAARLGMSVAVLAREELRLSGQWLKRVRAEGLSADLAERYAQRFGFHPVEIWPDYGCWLCASCGAPFAPYTRMARYCSQRCRNREKARRYRERDQGEHNRRYRRRYYQEVGA